MSGETIFLTQRKKINIAFFILSHQIQIVILLPRWICPTVDMWCLLPASLEDGNGTSGIAIFVLSTKIVTSDIKS